MKDDHSGHHSRFLKLGWELAYKKPRGQILGRLNHPQKLLQSPFRHPYWKAKSAKSTETQTWDPQSSKVIIWGHEEKSERCLGPLEEGGERTHQGSSALSSSNNSNNSSSRMMMMMMMMMIIIKCTCARSVLSALHMSSSHNSTVNQHEAQA